jgi:hypothetical protein
LSGTPEIEFTWKFGGQNRIVVDKAFEMDLGYAAVRQ